MTQADLFDPLQARRDLAAQLRREPDACIRQGDSIVPGARAGDVQTSAPKPKGEARKQAGISATLQAERDGWLADALSALRAYAVPGREFACEEFRGYWLARGMAAPHSHHVWGALFATAAKAGIVEQMGYRKATSEKTHAHPVGLWRSR